MKDRLLTTGTVARMMSVDPKTVRKWCDDGRVACERTTVGYRKIDRAELRKFAAENGYKIVWSKE